jgi:hypothetical protein
MEHGDEPPMNPEQEERPSHPEGPGPMHSGLRRTSSRRSSRNFPSTHSGE